MFTGNRINQHLEQTLKEKNKEFFQFKSQLRREAIIVKQTLKLVLVQMYQLKKETHLKELKGSRKAELIDIFTIIANLIANRSKEKTHHHLFSRLNSHHQLLRKVKSRRNQKHEK